MGLAGLKMNAADSFVIFDPHCGASSSAEHTVNQNWELHSETAAGFSYSLKLWCKAKRLWPFSTKPKLFEGMGVDQKPSYEGAPDPKALKNNFCPYLLC